MDELVAVAGEKHKCHVSWLCGLVAMHYN